jgi:glutathione S-transferase
MTTNTTERTLTTFGWVPEKFRGMVRDVRVRWALEEAGLPYQTRLIGPDDQKTPAYRALQPFGQVPAYQDGEVALFESGAIVHHIAAGSAALMPPDEAGRSRTLSWMFAALNSVEPYIGVLYDHDNFGAGGDGADARRSVMLERVKSRLGALESELQNRDYLLERFTAADILMASVLNILAYGDLLGSYPTLQAYLARCQSRPAARKALADHMAVFAGHAVAA